ncbi:MAG: penicillin acylase family protein, partial [Calditrichaeota bacterium]|nr:penicillin acylase family protein [Calditrichota bacterium]
MFKAILHFLLTVIFATLLLWPFVVMPRLGPYLNYFSGFIQIKAPHLIDPSTRFIQEAGISAEIYIDSIGVPHIYASDNNSTAFALGYMHARDRLFQMELMMRMVQGRLSELFSSRALESDIFWRSFQFVKLADENIKSLQKDNPQLIEAIQNYCDGVNTYIDKLTMESLPEEFHLLDFRPQRWELRNIVLLNKYMSFLLTYNKNDLYVQRVINSLPDELIKTFYPLQEKYLNSVIPEKTGKVNPNDRMTISRNPMLNSLAIAAIDHDRIESQKDIGSNNWVVSGKKSKSGKAILSNDTHLSLNLPPPWYEVHMKTPEKHTYGLSIPGSAVSIIGTNGKIAWGITNAHWDLVDYYSVNYAGSDSLSYYSGNEIKQITIAHEVIKIKGQNDFDLAIKKTDIGPILTIEGDELIVDWIAADQSDEAIVLFKLEEAANWTEFKNALSHWTSPPQNFVFADTAGNIGLYTAGAMPLRSAGKERG